MAHNRDYKPEDIAFPDQIITESELIGEMKSYSIFVIARRLRTFLRMLGQPTPPFR